MPQHTGGFCQENGRAVSIRRRPQARPSINDRAVRGFSLCILIGFIV
jgi:hypothetical protein